MSAILQNGFRLFNILRYGFFAFPAAISLLTMQVYMPTFIAQTTTFSFTTVGIIFFVARLIDTGTDPLIGYFSDRTPQKFGRRRIWLIAATPFFLLVFFALLEPTDQIITLLIQTALWYAFGTCLLVPYYAWGAEIEQGYEAHNRYTASRVIFGLLGTLAALALPFVFLSDPSNNTAVLNFNVGLASAAFFAALLLMLFLPDRKNDPKNATTIRETFSVFKKGSLFNQLIFSQLINGTANALPATLFILFATHILMRPDLVGPILVLYFLFAGLSVPFWVKAADRWSKERCWRVAMLAASVVFLGTLFVDESALALFVGITIITGLMAGADLCLPASMLADLIDIDEHNSGHRRPGVYFAIWGTVSKFTLAIAIGVVFPMLDFGSIVDATSQNTINEKWLIVMYGVVPALLKVISVYLLRNYQLSKADHAEIVAQLKA